MEERKIGNGFFENANARIFDPLQIVGRDSQRLAAGIKERIRSLSQDEGSLTAMGYITLAGTAMLTGSVAWILHQPRPIGMIDHGLVAMGMVMGFGFMVIGGLAVLEDSLQDN